MASVQYLPGASHSNAGALGDLQEPKLADIEIPDFHVRIGGLASHTVWQIINIRDAVRIAVDVPSAAYPTVFGVESGSFIAILLSYVILFITRANLGVGIEFLAILAPWRFDEFFVFANNTLPGDYPNLDCTKSEGRWN